MGKINYLIFLAVFLVGSSLFAQEENSDAKKSFNDGVAAFENKDFETALKSFEAAYSLNPSWKLLYNIGQCQGALKKYGLAVGSFEKYLSTGGDDIEDGRRNEVLGELEKMRQMIGDIEITGKDGLDVYVDDTLRGTTPLPGAISVSAGIIHKVDLKQDGEIVYSTNKSVRGGKISRVVYVSKDDADQLEVVMSSSSSGKDPENDKNDTANDSDNGVVNISSASENDKGRRKLSPVPFWITAGATVAFGTTAIVTAAYVGSKNDNVTTQSEADRLNNLRVLGLVTLFGAVGTGISAVVLSIFTDFKGKSKDVSVVPFKFYATPEEGGIILSGSF